MDRRRFLQLAAGAAVGVTAVTGRSTILAQKKARVVVIGGGYGGATAAKYLRMWGDNIEVILLERNSTFVSCPQSNLVLGGSRTARDLTTDYNSLVNKYGVKFIQTEVTGIDARARAVALKDGSRLSYDRLILSPGVDFMYETIPGLNNAAAQEKFLHAWKAGPQTVALRKQLEAMRNGGAYVLSIPKTPYRCPPGPYERACQVAFYFKQNKPKSKIIILDANPDIVSKKDLFTKAWEDLYPGLIEYRPNNPVNEVDVAGMVIKTDFENVKADVLNVVPPHRAGDIAQAAGVANVDNLWCSVDLLTYESKVHKHIHVIGDAIASPAGMPKSGHVANQTAKVCAAAVIALINGDRINPEPIFANTCYSWVSDKEAMNVAGVYKFDAATQTMAAVAGSSGVSAQPSELEGGYAQAWAKNIWGDMLL
ncbi:MAG TPA: NAD(P)/FAD-dependent oxidoreductase [Acidiferrobacterales bacterium]|nr:NAD(P)/FAD-dependent oxidoreductase [Acidiferrobacterales bacterium]